MEQRRVRGVEDGKPRSRAAEQACWWGDGHVVRSFKDLAGSRPSTSPHTYELAVCEHPAGIGRGERVARRYPAQDWRR
ncbi:hypothetical protein JCM13580A_62610 [Streptomyces drozdowiczii]